VGKIAQRREKRRGKEKDKNGRIKIGGWVK